MILKLSEKKKLEINEKISDDLIMSFFAFFANNFFAKVESKSRHI